MCRKRAVNSVRLHGCRRSARGLCQCVGNVMEVQFVHGVIVGHARGHEDILALSCKCPTQMHRTEALICTTRSEFSITLRGPRV